MDLLEQLFSVVCGRQHVWTLGDVALPFCQRCTGLYVGSLPAMVLLCIFRPPPTRGALCFHGALLLLMVPCGYHWIPHGAGLRTLTGQLFAAGLIYFLALSPGVAAGLWRQATLRRRGAYLVGLLGELVALQVAIRAGGRSTGTALAWLGLLGLLGIAALALTNLILLPRAFRRVGGRSVAP